MIDVRLLRTDLERVRASLARRGDPAVLEQLDEAARLDARLREIAAERDAVRARVNELSKQVGQLRRDGRTAEAEARQAESRELGEAEKVLVDEHDEVAGALRDLLLVIPNLIHPDVPDGASAADNPVVHGPIGLPASFGEHQRVPHWEVGTALGILDVERAVKISGAMFAMTRGLGATLSRALCQFALDRNADAFEEIRPPSLVTTATLTASGQLPKFADDAFAVERDELWCIPTAEVPLTSMYGDEILAEADLAAAADGIHAVLPPRGRRGRAGHARAAPLARVRQGRDPRHRHARAGAGDARRAAGEGGSDHRRRSDSRTAGSRSAPATSGRATTSSTTSRSTRPGSISGSRSRR